MKVLQVNCTYGVGSTGKIVRDLHHALPEYGVASVVCYGRGGRSDERNVRKISTEVYSKMNNAASRFTGLMYGGCFFSTKKLMRIIRKEQPDVVHLHCINGYFVNIYRLIAWLNKNRFKTILTLHAEFMHTANCSHAMDCDRWKTGCGNCPRLKAATKSLLFDNTARSFRKMKKAFEGFEALLTVISVSPWLRDRAQQSPILSGKRHCVIYNGVNTDIFKPSDPSDLRRKHGIKDERILFHAAPYFSDDPNHIKGGYYILKLAEMLRDENVKVLVAGNHPDKLQVPENVILLGQIRDQYELAKYYSMADVTVLTSKKETFSMITAESLCCGTPVAGFKAGGPEQIALDEFCRFSEWGDMTLLAESIQSLIGKAYVYSDIADCAAQKYSNDTMIGEYYSKYLD